MPRDCYLSIYNRKDEKYENQKADNHAVHQLFMCLVVLFDTIYRIIFGGVLSIEIQFMAQLG